VINSSLQGIIEAARSLENIGVVYGPATASRACSRGVARSVGPGRRRGVAATLHAAAGSIGTCRYKLKKGQDEDFQRVIDVLRATKWAIFCTSAA